MFISSLSHYCHEKKVRQRNNFVIVIVDENNTDTHSPWNPLFSLSFLHPRMLFLFCFFLKKKKKKKNNKWAFLATHMQHWSFVFLSLLKSNLCFVTVTDLQW